MQKCLSHYFSWYYQSLGIGYLVVSCNLGNLPNQLSNKKDDLVGKVHCSTAKHPSQMILSRFILQNKFNFLQRNLEFLKEPWRI